MGMANTNLERRAAVPIEYAMAAGIPADLPNGRLISNVVSSQTGPIANAAEATDMVWQWGQFLDHDISLTPEADPRGVPADTRARRGSALRPDGNRP